MESHQKIIILGFQAISKLMEYYTDDFAKTLEHYQCANPKFEILSFKEVAKQADAISKNLEEGQEMIDFEEYLKSQIEFYQKILQQKIVLEEASMKKTYCLDIRIESSEIEDELEEEVEEKMSENVSVNMDILIDQVVDNDDMKKTVNLDFGNSKSEDKLEEEEEDEVYYGQIKNKKTLDFGIECSGNEDDQEKEEEEEEEEEDEEEEQGEEDNEQNIFEKYQQEPKLYKSEDKLQEEEEEVDYEQIKNKKTQDFFDLLFQRGEKEDDQEKEKEVDQEEEEEEDEQQEQKEEDNELNIFEEYQQEPKLQKKIKKDNDGISSPQQKYPKQVIQEYIDNMQQNTDNTFIINYLNSLMKLLNYETQKTQYILNIQTLTLFISLNSEKALKKIPESKHYQIGEAEVTYYYDMSDIKLKNTKRLSINKIFVHFDNQDEEMYIGFQYKPGVSYPSIYCDSDVVAEINCFRILETLTIVGKSVAIKIHPDIFFNIKRKRLEKLIKKIQKKFIIVEMIEMETDIEIDQFVYLEAGKFCKTSKRIVVDVDYEEMQELFSRQNKLFYLNQLIINPSRYRKIIQSKNDIDDMFDSNVLFTYTDRELNYGIEMLLQILVLNKKNIQDVLLNGIANVVYDLLEQGW